MQNERLYTLEQLAQEFDLTPRTARHYIEKLLPESHRKGRGKLAIYGRDTWNCFAFIQKARDEQKLSLEQIRDVLAKLSQRQIDRVVRGEEEIAIVTAPAEPELPPEARAHYYPSREWAPEDEGPMISKMGAEGPSAKGPREELSFLAEELSGSRQPAARSAPATKSIRDERRSDRSEPWNTLFEDDRLRILIRGEVSGEQREEVSLAARFIRKILALED